MRVVLIEDHNLTRVGLKAALEEQVGIQVVGEAANAVSGLNVLESYKPDVAIVDIGLPDMDGIELTRKFRQSQSEAGEPATKILILTLHDSEDAVLAAFAAGADSYCMKDIGIEQLVEALQSTNEGNSWIDPAIASIVLGQVRRGTPKMNSAPESETVKIKAVEPQYQQLLQAYPLTERELEVLELIVSGCSNVAIAQKLYITVGTVKTHVRNILNKLSVDDRTQAAVHALRSGLIT
ncbi:MULTISPECIES: response regulator [unclassified Coleofasciculus]|uniref:response regulator n=1 Tax=unclassified Coleofasciculus TaxID=2692782 RepID=UPI00187E06AB|nr:MULTISPECIES: response regulator transcription factor [unclassified Coleofasciculus]MBE9127521.1 response regulator transcription factor [Coleofasciculus sp. LEGE 07081]MBE9150817.1 response regulator transcription factor [Coleofasciculus sp. LEGE 07092]